MKKLRLRVSPLVAVLMVAMVLTDRSGVCLVTFLAAFLHECGHLAAAKLLHISPKCLRLDFLGAHLSLRGEIYSYGTEWLLCAAGPFASLLCAAAGAAFWQVLPLSRAFSCASLVLGVLNLLPIRSFDGGRMLECTLCRLCGEGTAARVMTLCSFLFLFLLWATAVYFLLRAADGLSLLVFSMSLLFRFFDAEGDIFEEKRSFGTP